MNWDSVQQNWTTLRGRVTGHRGKFDDDDHKRDRRDECLQARYGIAPDEAKRKRRDWIKEPGVLDDWNDTRAILDM